MVLGPQGHSPRPERTVAHGPSSPPAPTGPDAGQGSGTRFVCTSLRHRPKQNTSVLLGTLKRKALSRVGGGCTRFSAERDARNMRRHLVVGHLRSLRVKSPNVRKSPACLSERVCRASSSSQCTLPQPRSQDASHTGSVRCSPGGVRPRTQSEGAGTCRPHGSSPREAAVGRRGQDAGTWGQEGQRHTDPDTRTADKRWGGDGWGRQREGHVWARRFSRNTADTHPLQQHEGSHLAG